MSTPSASAAATAPATAVAAKIQPLPPDTVSSITSGQVIVDVASAVKELIENSIDAGATAITVTLIDHGRKSITVADNGSGIAPQDRPCMARRYYTSKLRAFADLESVTSLGFRGEALHSLATLSQSLTITTRTMSDKVGAAHSIDNRGEVVSTKVASATVGTSVCATNLFHTLPVRRTTLLKKKENLKPLLHTYALAYPFVQFTLVDGSDRWVKPASKTLRDAIGSVHGRVVADGCMYLSVHAIDYVPATPSMTECTLSLVLPTVASLSKDTKPFATKPPLYTLNQRPIKPPRAISQLVKSHLERAGCRSAFHLIGITLPPGTFDINVDPAKSQVMSECISDLVQVLDRVLSKTYEPMLAEKTTVEAPASARSASGPLDEQSPSSYMDPPPTTMTTAAGAGAAPPTPPRTSSSQPAAASPYTHLAPPSTPLLSQPAPPASLVPTPLIHAFHQRAIQPVSIHSLLTPGTSGGPVLDPEPNQPDSTHPSVHRIRALGSDNEDQDDDEEHELVVAPNHLLPQPKHGPLPMCSNAMTRRPSPAPGPPIGGLFTPSKSPRATGGGKAASQSTKPTFVSPSQVRQPRPSQGGLPAGQTTLFSYLGKKSGMGVGRAARASQVDRITQDHEEEARFAAQLDNVQRSSMVHDQPSPSLPTQAIASSLHRAPSGRLLSVSINLGAIRDHLLAAAPNAQAAGRHRPVVARKVVGPLVGERLQVVLVDDDVVWIEEVVDSGKHGLPVWSIVNGCAVGGEDG
ncbi:hypothetical protein BCR44DRAFT_1511501 [Catenaria anguillulae PL171]|uniref:DNA mismatch repair protein S5 domain-containing protein n=1 Tax=Catenaria anguillulae PL171 TaxID=765915 RepID=A0A1Y2HT29_9FUNG|nr:hypothetical protein BCR44DRAFT_1511501 [Catenaria anguillulae PL171]